MSDWNIVATPKALLELAALPADMQARFDRILGLIEAKGLLAMREPYVRPLTGKLWEIRVKGKDGIARAIYFTWTGKRVVVLRAFIKKTQKAPQSEIELAQRRMKEWIDAQS